MSRTIRIDAAPYARNARAAGTSRRYRRAVLAVGTPLLMMTVTAGCTAQPSGASASAESASRDGGRRSHLLADAAGERRRSPPGKYVVSPFDAPASAPRHPC